MSERASEVMLMLLTHALTYECVCTYILYNVCDNINIIGINKPTWRLYEYNFDMIVMEERYNIIVFESGLVKLKFSR